jgi:DNA-binding MarR family transcriptional regulator
MIDGRGEVRVIGQAKLKYSHWELMLLIYQEQKSNKRPYKWQCNKTLVQTCIKNGWVKEYEDETVEVTEKGEEVAKEITPLYERMIHSGYPY